MAQCLAAHVPGLSRDLRRAIEHAPHSDAALRKAEKLLFEDRAMEALVGTTQAVDIISGGVKSNALPERALAIVNSRIATQSSVNATKEHFAILLQAHAQRFNLSYTAFGQQITDAAAAAAAYGTLTLTAPIELEPAPTTPAEGKPYQLLAGTIQATYASRRSSKLMEDEDRVVVVSPGIMSGNTDTKFYWKLSDHIFRYNHHYQDSARLPNVHTVNESLVADVFIEQIRFFTTLILNADEAQF